MARPERSLDPQGGPIPEFAADLRRLRSRSGKPGYRQMARTAHYSATTLSDAAGGRRMPTLEVTLAYVRACGGDVTDWAARWRSAVARLSGLDRGLTAGQTLRLTDPTGRPVARWTVEVTISPA